MGPPKLAHYFSRLLFAPQDIQASRPKTAVDTDRPQSDNHYLAYSPFIMPLFSFASRPLAIEYCRIIAGTVVTLRKTFKLKLASAIILIPSIVIRLRKYLGLVHGHHMPVT